MNDRVLIIGIAFISMIPFITYMDYYLLKNAATCPQCGKEPPKHTWLLATVLEAFMLIVGLLIGSNII
jgi:hypothetical protein